MSISASAVVSRLFALIVAGCASVSIASGASRPILDYGAQAVARILESRDSFRQPPASAFHSLEDADKEADRILRSWMIEPPSIAWTRIQLDRYVKHKMMPTRGARGLALVHVAMHDAYVIAVSYKVEPSIAVSMAAAQVLGYLFVAEERSFDRIVYAVASKHSGVPRDRLSDATIQAIALGHGVGQRVVAHAETDGAQRGWNGARLQYYGEGRVYGPGTWQPTPPYFYYPPDEPFAPFWKPWTLAAANEFRPVPPAFGSARYLRDLREVLTVNRQLSDEQLKIARHWVDGHGTVTPPGHWNRIAIEASIGAKLGGYATAQLFAVLNIALADTFIAVWDTKYFYWTARPITVSRAVFGEDLKPPILTPPFPSYVSGHAAFSGASARVLGEFIPKQAKKFEAQAEEAANSRLLGGIHFRHDNEDGLVLGRSVAEKVLRHLLYP